MLSDRERETLNELQRQFESEDPSLVRKFVEPPAPIQKSHDWLLDLTAGVFTLLAAFAILLGFAASTIAFATFAVFLALLRHRAAQKPDESHSGKV
jgi:uncharacterized membrane protein YphA (DoxX/SURF4 family)